jgi:hypothetical protein
MESPDAFRGIAFGRNALSRETRLVESVAAEDVELSVARAVRAAESREGVSCVEHAATNNVATAMLAIN